MFSCELASREGKFLVKLVGTRGHQIGLLYLLSRESPNCEQLSTVLFCLKLFSLHFTLFAIFISFFLLEIGYFHLSSDDICLVYREFIVIIILMEKHIYVAS